MESIHSRLKIISKVIATLPELGSPSFRELRSWVTEELGSADVLDSFQKKGNRSVRAVAPERMLIIGAGNLAVSLWQSLLVGFILGSQIWVKAASGTGPELLFFLKKFPVSFRKKVVVLDDVPSELLKLADAVVVLGSDETIQEIQKNLHPKQRFVSYGHKTSAIWAGEMPRRSKVFDQIANDIALYGQQGCLSPRWIWLSNEIDPAAFLRNLSQAMDRWKVLHQTSVFDFELTPSQEALIYELRETHRALGNNVYYSKGNLDWTMIQDLTGNAELTDLPRVIFVRSLSEKGLLKEFAWMTGDLSTVGVYGKVSKKLEAIWTRWGVSRICGIGKMQKPLLNWFHDGRPQISDLVRWVEKSDDLTLI